MIERRAFLKLTAIFMGVPSIARAAPCATLDGSDGGLHESLHYTESSSNPAQTCSACGFFSKPAGSCGECQIFNGPVNAKGRCDSWAART